MIRALLIALVLALCAACTPAQVTEWFAGAGVEITPTEAADIAEWVNTQDCLPGYDRPQYTECAVADAARRFGIPLAWFAATGWCESRLQPDAVNPTSTAAGLYQFIWATWEWVAAHTGWGDRFNARQNAMNAGWLWATQGSHHWSCA